MLKRLLTARQRLRRPPGFRVLLILAGLGFAGRGAAEEVETAALAAAGPGKKIFTEYFRTRVGKRTAKGYGVGLAFAKAILESHGSAIQVKSAPGRGSRFYFSMPLLDGTSGPKAEG